VAQSLGTVLGLQVVLEDPDAFDTLTLGAPALGGGPFDADLWSRYGEVKTMHAREGLSPALRERWSAPGAALFGGLDRRPELAREIRRVVARHPWWELADDAYLRLWQTPQALKDLAEVAVPTLVLVGGRDGVAVRQCAEFFERLVPNCSRHDIEGAGHLCLLEDAASVACLIEAHWNAHAPFAAVGEA
jgi:pimeloyl-ACP methyl ester carboxylesterase